MLWEGLTAARDLGRMHEIASVLVRHGFADLITRSGLRRALARAGRVLKLSQEAAPELSTPVRFRLALEALGPTFVKLGQLMATRVDLFGPQWIAEFERLQNQVPSVPFDEIRPLLEHELGGPLEEVLGEVDPTPLAAASIAQVHRARLHDGSEVVIKIRRPGIAQVIQADLRLLERLAQVLEHRFPEIARFHPCQVVRHFRASIKRELDLAAECRNAERMATALAPMDGIVVPRVHWAWTTAAVNVQDFLAGRPLGEVDRDAEAAASGDLPAIARMGAEAILQMVFVDGFFHADPHGGNVLYLKDGRIGLIDFGMVGHVSEARRGELVALLHGLVGQDVERIVAVVEQWAGAAPRDPELLREDILGFLDRYHGVPLAQIRLGVLLAQVARVIREHGLVLPADLAMVIKVFITLEGLGQKLDPDFDMVGVAAPFLKRVLRERYHPGRVARRTVAVLGDAVDTLALVPRQLRRLMQAAEDGGPRLRVDVEQIPDFGDKVARSANRLSLGLVIAALIVGSSIVMTVKGGPTLAGLPVLGLVGFVGSVVGGLWLLVSILRTGGGR